MGLAKNEGIERDERGWADVGRYVCAECVEDEFLKSLIEKSATQHSCDYCGKGSSAPIAAPVEVLLPVILDTANYFYSDPNLAGVAWDEGEWVIRTIETDDMLEQVRLECHAELFDDIVIAIDTDDWVEAAQRHWLSLHSHEEYGHSWASFVEVVKHQTRFYFRDLTLGDDDDPREIEPGKILDVVGTLVKESRLHSKLNAGTVFHRVRHRSPTDTWQLDEGQLGAPPGKLARAGRMNPSGISYLYLALEPETAIAEVIDGPPCGIAIAEFAANRELTVLDLAALPAMPSIFDETRRDDWESLVFIRNFVSSISRPVRKDGLEHIEYVPSQVVCEYFATVFRLGDNVKLDGIAYPSTVRPGGRNLVLFPTERRQPRKFAHVHFVGAVTKEFLDWSSVTMAVR